MNETSNTVRVCKWLNALKVQRGRLCRTQKVYSCRDFSANKFKTELEMPEK